MPIIINEMIANVRPDNDPVAVDSSAPQSAGGDEAARLLAEQLKIDREREERLSID